MFRFLEPKKLARDGVTLFDGRVADGLAEARKSIAPVDGYYPVKGGEKRYLLIIKPIDPTVTGVQVHRVPGKIEPTPKGEIEKGVFATELLVTQNSIWTETERVYYDLIAKDGRKPAQGELFFEIAAAPFKQALLAAGAGAGLMVKSLATFVMSWSGGDEARPLDFLGLVVMPGVFLGLWGGDWLRREFFDEL